MPALAIRLSTDAMRGRPRRRRSRRRPRSSVPRRRSPRARRRDGSACRRHVARRVDADDAARWPRRVIDDARSPDNGIVPHVVSDAAAAIVIGHRYPDEAVPDAMLVATVSASDRAAAGVRIVRVEAPFEVPPATRLISTPSSRRPASRDRRPTSVDRWTGGRPRVAPMDQGSRTLARERRRDPGRRSAVRSSGPAKAGHYRTTVSGPSRIATMDSCSVRLQPDLLDRC